MKTIYILFFIFAPLLALTSKAQTKSDINYSSSTIVEVQNGADICADKIDINGTWSGGGTICMGVMPVSLSSFVSSVNKRDVTLMWVTEWEMNNSGFSIERTNLTLSGTDGWKDISFVEGRGTSNVSNGYMFKDEKLKSGKYQYRLKQVDYNGKYEYFDLGAEVDVQPPKNFEMSQNYPNPGNPNTKINFEMPVNGKVNIVVYDLLGREVVTLLNENREADFYTVELNGSNIASGVYFYRINAEGEGQKFTKTMKMIMVK